MRKVLVSLALLLLGPSAFAWDNLYHKKLDWLSMENAIFQLKGGNLYYPYYRENGEAMVVAVDLTVGTARYLGPGAPRIDKVFTRFGQGDWLLYNGENRQLQLWNAELNRPKKTLALPSLCSGQLALVDVSQSQRYLGCGHAVKDNVDGTEENTLGVLPGYFINSFFLDNRYYITYSARMSSDDKRVDILDLSQKKTAVLLKGSQLQFVLAGPGQQIVLSESGGWFQQPQVKMLDLNSGKQHGLYKGEISGLRLSPAKHFMLVSNNSGINVFELDPETGLYARKRSLDTVLPPQSQWHQDESRDYNNLAFIGEQKVMVVNQHHKLQLWDLTKGALLVEQSLKAGDGAVTVRMQWDQAGYLALQWSDGVMDVFKVDEGLAGTEQE